ncbi:MAG: hypothetical protein JKX78_06320 [Alteromonadaceae bacterium]|nr:hypothetical protein [Alteromonadaceae bacterium]
MKKIVVFLSLFFITACSNLPKSLPITYDIDEVNKYVLTCPVNVYIKDDREVKSFYPSKENTLTNNQLTIWIKTALMKKVKNKELLTTIHLKNEKDSGYKTLSLIKADISWLGYAIFAHITLVSKDKNNHIIKKYRGLDTKSNLTSSRWEFQQILNNALTQAIDQYLQDQEKKQC